MVVRDRGGGEGSALGVMGLNPDCLVILCIYTQVRTHKMTPPKVNK